MSIAFGVDTGHEDIRVFSILGPGHDHAISASCKFILPHELQIISSPLSVSPFICA
jgi:hypothetical protein